MKPVKAMASAMSMDEATWLRHANPWSVWKRFFILPLLALAIWARVWLGWWSLALAFIMIFKMWFLDRMVWLYDDMAREVSEYAGWLR